MIAWILISALLIGQIIKIGQGVQGGLTVLDLTVIFLDLLALFQLKFKLKSPPVWIKAAFLFMLVAGISLLLTPLKLNLNEYLNSTLYLGRLVSFFLLGWLLYSGAFSSLKNNIGDVLVFSGVGLAFLGILQLIFLPNLGFLSDLGWDPHYFRTVSTLLDPNFVGAYLILTLILLIQQSLSQPKSKWRICALIIVYLTCITTFSRSTALMLLTSLSIVSLLNKSLKLFLLALVLVLGFGLGFLAYQKIVAQPRNIDRVSSANYRLTTWQQGWQLFTSHSIFGIGFNAYRYALREYNLGTEQFLQSRGSTTNDSSLLYVAATTGIVGLICYLAMLLTMIQSAFGNWQTGNIWGTVLLSSLGGLIFHSLFANSLFYPWILVWIILVSIQLDLPSNISKGNF